MCSCKEKKLYRNLICFDYNIAFNVVDIHALALQIHRKMKDCTSRKLWQPEMVTMCKNFPASCSSIVANDVNGNLLVMVVDDAAAAVVDKYIQRR